MYRNAILAGMFVVSTIFGAGKHWDSHFPVGCYLYTYVWEQNTNAQVQDLSIAVKKLASLGFTYVYLGGVKDNALWNTMLEICDAHRISIIPQLDFAYISSPDVSKVPARAALAAEFIKKYKDHPSVAAFSVKEEPSPDYLPAIKEYYTIVLREVPDAPLMLLHNSLPAIQQMKPPYPRISGTDRYCFWWEWGTAGNRATPRSALRWFHTQMDAFYQSSAQQNAEFHAVFTANTLEGFRTTNKVRTMFYPSSIAEDTRQTLFERVLKFANSTDQGFNRISEDIVGN